MTRTHDPHLWHETRPDELSGSPILLLPSPVALRYGRVSVEARRQGSETLPSPSAIFLYSVYVLIALSLGEYGAIDGSADPKGKLQLTVF